ncbi:hypothetical protein D0T49_00685 [Paludibacter sp. 221]|nr:hypothetical protein [Paludibacter sp. 221]
MILFKLSTSFCLDAKGTKTNFIEAPTLSKIQVNLIQLSLKRRIQNCARFARKTVPPIPPKGDFLASPSGRFEGASVFSAHRTRSKEHL